LRHKMFGAALVARAGLRHSFVMSRYGWWITLGRAVLAGALLGGCAFQSDDSADLAGPSPDSMLGGQTGSLIPSCGVAPLSEQGRSVPSGDAIAILYAGACPEDITSERVTLTTAGGLGVGVELEPLGIPGVYLIRTEQTLEAGDYGFSLQGEAPSTLSVSDAAPAPPRSLGPLRALPNEATCPDSLGFELELDEAMLAYAPLLRLSIRVDGLPLQPWIDYGALELETSPDGARSVIEVPRCGKFGCLDTGNHSLELSAELATQATAPDPVEVDFSLSCPLPPPEDGSCAVSAGQSTQTSSASAALLTCCAALLCRLTLRSSRPARPHSH
jgi:hypothetical protein